MHTTLTRFITSSTNFLCDKKKLYVQYVNTILKEFIYKNKKYRQNSRKKAIKKRFFYLLPSSGYIDNFLRWVQALPLWEQEGGGRQHWCRVYCCQTAKNPSKSFRKIEQNCSANSTILPRLSIPIKSLKFKCLENVYTYVWIHIYIYIYKHIHKKTVCLYLYV
jgi:hypothetical protein